MRFSRFRSPHWLTDSGPESAGPVHRGVVAGHDGDGFRRWLLRAAGHSASARHHGIRCVSGRGRVDQELGETRGTRSVQLCGRLRRPRRRRDRTMAHRGARGGACWCRACRVGHFADSRAAGIGREAPGELARRVRRLRFLRAGRGAGLLARRPRPPSDLACESRASARGWHFCHARLIAHVPSASRSAGQIPKYVAVRSASIRRESRLGVRGDAASDIPERGVRHPAGRYRTDANDGADNWLHRNDLRWFRDRRLTALAWSKAGTVAPDRGWAQRMCRSFLLHTHVAQRVDRGGRRAGSDGVLRGPSPSVAIWSFAQDVGGKNVGTRQLDGGTCGETSARRSRPWC